MRTKIFTDKNSQPHHAGKTVHQESKPGFKKDSFYGHKHSDALNRHIEKRPM
jgi:hypothetical protein